MQFKDVVGQNQLKNGLPQLMQENRLAHAIIFLGKEGSGALPLAIAFAQYILCEKVNRPAVEAGPSLFGDAEPAEAVALPTDSCGVCPSCLKAAAIAHPDIHFSYPVVTKKAGTPPLSADYAAEWRDFLKISPYGNAFDWLQSIGAENKQGNITAAECNDIIRQLNLKSFEGGYKVLIMWMPEYLGNEGNKLLKLIEEPPDKTIFLFVAENDGQILPTILSRCQLIKVPALENDDVTSALGAKGINPAAAERAAIISGGNLREALMLASDSENDWQNLLRDWLNGILRTGPVAQIKWVDEVSKLGREMQKQFLRYFNHLLQVAVKMQVMESAGNNYPERDREFAQRLNKITGISQQQAIIEELDKAAYYIERNANSKMLFSALTIKIYHIIQDKVVFLNE